MGDVSYSYEKCLSRSRIASWDLAQFSDIELDFSKPFLPEDLAQTQRLTVLSPRERLALNQVRGHAYAYLFRFVEEYIVGMVDGIQQGAAADAQTPRGEALALFLEEERKHQQLFLHFEEEFKQGFPVPCEVVGNMRAVAKVILGHSPLSVLILTAMLEWLTQAHYLAYFSDKDQAELDDSFRELFRLHWVEEAQHARIDALETLREAEPMDTGARDQAIREFTGICTAFIDILHSQAALDIESLERFAKRDLPTSDRAAVLAAQKSAYVHTFVGLGLRNRHFRDLIGRLTPNGKTILGEYLQQIAGAS